MCSMRIGGLASGMDIDSIVSDLMKVERMKVDKLEQEKQVLEWQQEDYRAINLALRGFRDKEAFNMKLQSTFLARQATSTNESVVTATGGVNAVEGLHSIEVEQLASGASITGNVIGSTTDKSTIGKQFPTAGSEERLIINGVEFKVNTETESIYNLVNRINNNSFAGVSLNTTTQAVNPDEKGTTEEEKNGVAQVQTLKLTDDALVEGLTISLAGKKIVLYDSTNYKDSEAAKEKFGADVVIDIKKVVDETTGAVVNRTASEVMKEIAALSIDETVELGANYVNGDPNGLVQEITITSTEPGTENAVSAKITGGKAWNVRASYDETLDRFFLTTNKTGSDQQIEVNRTHLSQLLKITNGASVNTADYENAETTIDLNGIKVNAGQNARVTIDGLEDIEYQSNQFTLNNITYNLHNVSEGQKTTISVTQDSDAIFDSVKSFVDKYNETIELIEKKLEEIRYKDYTWPLSDDERESLTDDQINQWKDKARSGLLRNDGTLREIRDQLRYSMTQLSQIGIKTTGDYFTAKLEIDEDALRKAIQEDGQAVMKLFTGDANDSSNQGAAQRASEALTNGINTIIEKAGSSGNRVDDESYLGKRIDNLNDDLDNWEDRLTQIEDRYWRQFTAMEKAINQMNQQSAWLAQQFGGV